MPTIVQYVEKDANFLKIKGRKKLSDRESALLNAAFVVAESQLSKLKVKYEKSTADKRVEQERVKTATIATIAAIRIEGFGKWLNTPYIEYFSNDHSSDNVTEGQIIEQDRPIQLADHVKQSDKLITDSSTGYSDRSVADALPGWSRPIVLFIEQTFARMTPLTTALWFLIITMAFIALGIAQKSYLEGSFEHLGDENERLLAQESEFKENLEKLKIVEAQALQDKNMISSLRADNEEIRGEAEDAKTNLALKTKEFQLRFETQESQHQNVINSLQENADVAIKSQLEALTATKLRLQSENNSKNDQIDRLTEEADDFKQKYNKNEVTVKNQANTISDLNTSIENQELRLLSLQQERSQKNTLIAFNNSILELVNEVLYKRRYRRVNPYERKEDFTEGFNKLRRASKSTMDDLGIRKSM